MKDTKGSSSFTPSNLNDGFSEIPEEQKQKLIKNGLTLKPFKEPALKEMRISEVMSPSVFLRYDQQEDYSDLEAVENLEPIKVVSLVGKGYVVIDGLRRLKYLKKGVLETAQFMIAGEAVCRSQVGIARAVEMTKLTKPLNT
jgi:hypothetical protein